MVSDETSGSMIDYIMSMVDDPKVAMSVITVNKKNAVKSYNLNHEYLE